MGLSVDEIILKFPRKTIPTIQGEPDYGSISSMVQMMYGNAASLPTTLGGGQHGHVGLIMTPILYATLSDELFKNPDDPGTAPHHPNNATRPQREAQILEHKEDRRIYENNLNG
jgi:hypothetical protein